MLTLAVAASAFAACNKQETTPVVNDNMGNKSIVLNIANVMPGTKDPGSTIKNDTQVQLNSYQVFFSDGEDLYAPKTVTAENGEPTYFSGTAAATLTRQFHFLPKEVSKVIVVGNMPEITGITKHDDLLAKVNEELTIKSQQDPTALRLVGIDEALSTSSSTHIEGDTATDPHPQPLLKAEVNLVPTVARFEVTGFEYATDANGVRQYQTMTVNDLSLRGYFMNAEVSFAGAVNANTPDNFFSTVLDDDHIYPDYFNSDKLVKTEWYYDEVNKLGVDADKNPVYSWGVYDKDGKLDAGTDCYAYHVFPGAEPTFIVKLTATNEQLIEVDGATGNTTITSNLYLTTKDLVGMPENGPVAGDIYRMYFKFDDTNLNSAEKCIEVVITVAKWNVVVVTPDFGTNN